MANLGNIYWIDRPDMSALEDRLSRKHVLLLDRVYRYRRIRNFTLSSAAGEAADVVARRIANLHPERIAA